MAFEMKFTPIALADLHHEAAVKKTDGWRFVQTHAVNADNGVDLYYSFMKDGVVESLKVGGVTKDQAVPSITDLFLAAFVFENEARELFGVDMRDIAIDFAGAMYAPAVSEPMTFITPEQKAARDKARKAQEGKAARDDSAGKAEKAAADSKRVFVMTPERRERLDKKLANMSPEKVAKVEAAIKAREAEAAAAAQAGSDAPSAKAPAGAQSAEAAKKQGAAKQAADASPAPKADRQLEHAISLLDAQKAAKVRAALGARNGAPAAQAAQAADAPEMADAGLMAKIALMDEAKAEKVRKALAAKAARDASLKGGE